MSLRLFIGGPWDGQMHEANDCYREVVVRKPNLLRLNTVDLPLENYRHIYTEFSTCYMGVAHEPLMVHESIPFSEVFYKLIQGYAELEVLRNYHKHTALR